MKKLFVIMMLFVFPAYAEESPPCEIDTHQDFLNFDHDLDDKVTLEEMKVMPTIDGVTEEQKKELDDIRYQMFHMMDQDGDGFITRKELRKFTEKTMPGCVVK